MIPMRQLHTVVYARNEVLAAVGTEDAANAIAMEFIKQAPAKIRKMNERIQEEDIEGLKALCLKFGKMAAATGAKQIVTFVEDVLEEACMDEPSWDAMHVSVVFIESGFDRFMTAYL